jgi:hypothetical protein
LRERKITAKNAGKLKQFKALIFAPMGGLTRFTRLLDQPRQTARISVSVRNPDLSCGTLIGGGQ